MSDTGDEHTVTVTQARWEADGVLSLRLRGRQPLPTWTPGAHVDLVLPSGLVRQYSLCGDASDTAYTVAVLREPAGRGGSAELHDTALVGRTLTVRGPRNHFELADGPFHEFLGGGIGITPLLAMIRRLAADGRPWRLHYGGRTRGSLAFTGELADLASSSPGEVVLHHDDLDGPLPLTAIVDAFRADAVVHACGPPGLLTALEDAVVTRRPDLNLHTERFQGDPTAPVATGAEGYDVELARSGVTVAVAPGTSLLDAVRSARPDMMTSCEEGFCGTCETKVLEGTPVHGDTILSARERAKNTSMMICVGGCSSPRLVLDL